MPEEVIKPEDVKEIKEVVEKPTMDFATAVQALKDGKKVKSPNSNHHYEVMDSFGEPTVFRVSPNGNRQVCALPGMSSPRINSEVVPADKVYIEEK